MAKDLGQLRRSQVITTYGPGAIVDFRAGGRGGATVSAVVAGLEEWDRRSQPAGLKNPQTIFEPRLQRRLGVSGFRLPPVIAETAAEEAGPIPAVRFPQWLQCPGCGTLKHARRWSEQPGDPALYCGVCTARNEDGKRVHVVPVRFVAVCERGHLQEFPWRSWPAHSDSCTRNGDLKLVTRGAGLAGLLVICQECGSSRSLDGAFGKGVLDTLGVKCNGHRPWLAGGDEECGCQLRVTQRGASNMYFPVIQSALDIPPWSDRIQKMLGQYWASIANVEDPGQRTQFIGHMRPLLGDIGMSDEELSQLVGERKRLLEEGGGDIRREEYLQFCSDVPGDRENEEEFEIRRSPVPGRLEDKLDRVVRAVRLREVRAISGFSRLEPPEAAETGSSERIARVSKRDLEWLPAVEVRGEGIFLTLSEPALQEWEDRPIVAARVDNVRARYVEHWESRFGTGTQPDVDVTPRLLLIHTLSHVLMRRLALDCGYSAASLRERLYAQREGHRNMSGVLIYTASPDSDGTLGGLVRQALPDRLEELFFAALTDIRWCSSDPLCIEGVMSATEIHNEAACHACVLAPETSCEQFNRFLDRGLLIGTPGKPELGFFTELFQ